MVVVCGPNQIQPMFQNSLAIPLIPIVGIVGMMIVMLSGVMHGIIDIGRVNKFPMLPPNNMLGGNTVSVYVEKDNLLWAWGKDAKILSKILGLPLRIAIENKTVTHYVCFRYKGDIDELQTGLNRILPYQIAILR